MIGKTWCSFRLHRRIQVLEQQATFPKTKEVSKFFGGTPQTEGTAKSPDAARPLPKLQLPESPTGTAISPKKKKEGC